MSRTIEMIDASPIQQLTAILNHTPNAVFVEDLSGFVRSWNASAEKIFGYTEEEAVGKPSSMLLIPGRPDPVFAVKAGIISGAAPGPIETTWRAKNGSPIDVAVTAVPLSGDGHRPTALCVIARDREPEYREAQELALALDLAPVIVRRLDGTIVRWTSGMASLYGFSKLEAYGRVSHDLLQTRFPEPIDKINAILLEKGTWTGELEHRRKDGREINVISTWTLHRDRPLTLIEVNLDITQHKLATREIQRLNAELEQRVEERTAQVESSNRELEAFAYTISHDLRAPLRSMEGFSQALTEEYAQQIDATGADYISRIAIAARRMDELILDLLNYSRLGRSDIRLEPVDLPSVVRAAVEQLDSGVESVEIREPLYKVLGNRTILVQIVANLISNALKFHAPGVPAKLIISSQCANGRVRVDFTDSGIGIDPKFHDQIFQVFHRLHGTEAFPGTGIGLAIVRKGIERLGGAYGVESEPGKGSRFWFELPEVTSNGNPNDSSR
jgi:PAS domain S-box-containing protein